MRLRPDMSLWRLLSLLLLAVALAPTVAAYTSIQPSAGAHAVTLTGRDLTVEQVVEVARYGAKVEVSPEARRRGADTYGLMMEAAAEGVPVYLFNRAPGSGRQIVTFEGDPLSSENRPKLEARVLRQFRNGALSGSGREVEAEEVVRADMLVRANTMTYLAASPQLLQGVVDLLNRRITPVARASGGTGEADGPMIGAVNAVLVGSGEAWFQGRRMPAIDALRSRA